MMTTIEKVNKAFNECNTYERQVWVDLIDGWFFYNEYNAKEALAVLAEDYGFTFDDIKTWFLEYKMVK